MYDVTIEVFRLRVVFVRFARFPSSSVYKNTHVFFDDCLGKRGRDPVTENTVLVHCTAATGAIVGVSLLCCAICWPDTYLLYFPSG